MGGSFLAFSYWVVRISRAVRRCSWILEERRVVSSVSGVFANFFATILWFGTVTPINLSPSAYWPGPVLKKYGEKAAFSVSAYLLRDCLISEAVIFSILHLKEASVKVVVHC